MKQKLSLLLWLALAGAAFGQQNNGSITSTQCVQIDVTLDASTVGIQIAGTWTGTLQPQVSIQGQAFANTQVTPSTSTTAQATITANGVYYANVGGAGVFQVCGNSVGSGTALVYLNRSKGVNAGLFGSGVASGSASLVTSGLLAEYKMQEGSGTTLTDTSGNGNTATFCASGPTWIQGSNTTTDSGSQHIVLPVSGGLTFNGTSNCVLLPAALNGMQSIMFFISYQPAFTVGSGLSPMLLVGTGGTNLSSGFGMTSPSTGNNGQNSIEAVRTNFTRNTQSRAVWFGTGLLGFNLDTVDHIFINGKEIYYYDNQGTTANLQTAGQFSLGGTVTAGAGNFYPGSIYYFAGWNRVLTLAEESQMYSYVSSLMAQRGVPVAMGSTITNPTFLADGDSITRNGVSPPYTGNSNLTLNGGTWNVFNIGEGGSLATGNLTIDTLPQPLFCSNWANSVVAFWAGTNDMAASVSAQAVVNAYATYAKRMHAAGCKVVAVTMVSRIAQDANKNILNGLLRSQWTGFADALADVAAHPLLGADGANADANIFNSNLHPTSLAHQYITAPIISRAVNRIYGNQNFSAATTYGSATAAGQTITAASESNNTVTFTFASNSIAAGTHDVSVTGVTPAGYNQPCNVQASTGTTITCFNTNTGLGAGTVFGVAQVPSQVDADGAMILNFGAGNFLLQSCVGTTGQRIQLKNINAASSTIVPNSTETIDGAATATLATKATLVLESVLTSASAAGCSWKQVQNN